MKSKAKQNRISLIAKKAGILVVYFLSLTLLFPAQSMACSAHDHGCIYHAFGSTVKTDSQVTENNTSLVIYAIGTNNNQPSAVDFDNKVRLPEYTSGNLFDRTYYKPTGPYIVNSTPYGASNPPPDWNLGAGDGALQVYPSQYQVVFNKNTATAKHTGDLNGGENGSIPNSTGCPNMPGKANCEAVVVTGNVPNGFYEQRVRIFNFQNAPNPEVNIQLGAYTTGSGVLVSSSHIPIKNGGKKVTNGDTELADFISLSGTGDMTDTYKYEFYDRGFDVDRTGVAWFDRSKSRVRKSSPYVAGDHVVRDVYLDTTVMTTTVQGDGAADYKARMYHKKIGQDWVSTIREIPLIDIPDKHAFNKESNPFDISKISEVKFGEAFSISKNANQDSSFKQNIRITNYKDEWTIFGKNRVVESENIVVAYSKQEAINLIAIESAKHQNALDASNTILNRSKVAYVATGYVPILGEALSLGEAYYGVDPLTGERLTTADRALAAFGAFPGLGRASKFDDAANTISNFGKKIDLVDDTKIAAEIRHGDGVFNPIDKVRNPFDYNDIQDIASLKQQGVKVQLDHMYPQKEMKAFMSDKNLTSSERSRVLNDPFNFQNMIQSNNASKSSKTQDSGTPWQEHTKNGQLVDSKFSDNLDFYQRIGKIRSQTQTNVPHILNMK